MWMLNLGFHTSRGGTPHQIVVIVVVWIVWTAARSPCCAWSSVLGRACVALVRCVRGVRMSPHLRRTVVARRTVAIGRSAQSPQLSTDQRPFVHRSTKTIVELNGQFRGSHSDRNQWIRGVRGPRTDVGARYAMRRDCSIISRRLAMSRRVSGSIPSDFSIFRQPWCTVEWSRPPRA